MKELFCCLRPVEHFVGKISTFGTFFILGKGMRDSFQLFLFYLEFCFVNFIAFKVKIDFSFGGGFSFGDNLIDSGRVGGNHVADK